MANKNQFQMPLYATVELLGAFGRTEEGIKEYTADMEVDVNIVENTDAEVALALPYYSNMEGVPSAAALSEDELGNASAGGSAGILTDADRRYLQNWYDTTTPEQRLRQFFLGK